MVARGQVAELIGAQTSEIIFTSCGTESNNAAIQAALRATGKRHIVTSAVEHSSVLNYCKALEGIGCERAQRDTKEDGGNRELRESRESGLTAKTQAEHRSPRGRGKGEGESFPYRVTYLPVDRDGLLNVVDLENAITDETAVVSLMWAWKMANADLRMQNSAHSTLDTRHPSFQWGVVCPKENAVRAVDCGGTSGAQLAGWN